MDENRLKHSLVVARKMVEIAKLNKMSNEQIEICFLIGYNHDIGYEFSENGINHNKIGGEILKNSGFQYWKEIYYHGECNCDVEHGICIAFRDKKFLGIDSQDWTL